MVEQCDVCELAAFPSAVPDLASNHECLLVQLKRLDEAALRVVEVRQPSKSDTLIASVSNFACNG